MSKDYKTREQRLKELESKTGEVFVKTNNFRWYASKHGSDEFRLQQMHQGSKGTVEWESIEFVTG